MDIEVLNNIGGTKRDIWKAFLEKAQLDTNETVEQTVLVSENGNIIATGSRLENVLKCFAVDAVRQGEGLTATILTTLRAEAFKKGYNHLFLYTKPSNKEMFSSLFFYPIAQTNDVLLMENKKNGICDFINSMPLPSISGNIGAIVMNCNPFTLGHRYLIETSSKKCDMLYVFILSEDKSFFSADDRMEMVKLGTSDLANVVVLPTGPYLVSSATFPTYFLKERDDVEQVKCLLDIEIFINYFSKRFCITHRYVGTEPLSPMTKKYNDILKQHLPLNGIELVEIPRLENRGVPISASNVRKILKDGKINDVTHLLPKTTIKYLQSKGLL